MIKAGFGITVLWFMGIGYLCWYKWDDVLKMDMSSWGSFLSGSTAPVAFLWLVIGYLMQNTELKMNREILTAQTEALLVQADTAKAEKDEISRHRISDTFGKNWTNRKNLDQ